MKDKEPEVIRFRGKVYPDSEWMPCFIWVPPAQRTHFLEEEWIDVEVRRIKEKN